MLALEAKQYIRGIPLNQVEAELRKKYDAQITSIQHFNDEIEVVFFDESILTLKEQVSVASNPNDTPPQPTAQLKEVEEVTESKEVVPEEVQEMEGEKEERAKKKKFPASKKENS